MIESFVKCYNDNEKEIRLKLIERLDADEYLNTNHSSFLGFDCSVYEI